jgi:4-amino-4-deoxy-L-arabinose transferase-like glycosyltransferase
MYPAISGLSHTFFLDLPLVSMVAVAILALLWWRSVPTPTWWRTILTGLVIGAACLTKQLAVVYIAPVGLYFFVIDIMRLLDRKQEASRSSAQLAHTIGLGLVTAIIGLPFIVVNHAVAHEYLSGNVQVFADKAMNHSFLANLSVWCQDIPPAMSPFLMLIFITSFLVLRKREHVFLLPITLAAAGGLCATSASSAIAYDHRYIAPVLIAPAIFSGFGLEKLLVSKRRLWKMFAVTTMMLAIFNCL